MKLHVDAGVLESPIVSASKYMAYTQTPPTRTKNAARWFKP